MDLLPLSSQLNISRRGGETLLLPLLYLQLSSLRRWVAAVCGVQDWSGLNLNLKVHLLFLRRAIKLGERQRVLVTGAWELWSGPLGTEIKVAKPQGMSLRVAFWIFFPCKLEKKRTSSLGDKKIHFVKCRPLGAGNHNVGRLTCQGVCFRSNHAPSPSRCELVPHSGAKHVVLLHFFLNQIKRDAEPPLDKGSEKFATSQVMGCLSAYLGNCESVQKMWGEAFGF